MQLTYTACNLADTQYLGEITLEAEDDAKLESAKSRKLNEINDAFSSAMADLVTKYPEYEIKSWPQQVKEVEAYNADPESVTPLLTAIAVERSITVDELITKILTNRDLYAASAGALIGRRHAAENLIELVLVMLGLSGVRMVEKIKGVAK
ncbi:hypothetical protein [Nitrosomonas communis]|uniref:hypothetical protein n=1 Tax=Nitrosomonas communis TaxID=44574 RepID=UPI003D2B70E8